MLRAHCTCVAGYVYLKLPVPFLIYNLMQLHRLGEACSDIAAVISCLIRAAQLHFNSGMDACTSKNVAGFQLLQKM